jgi:hypothetical protein
MKMNHEWIWNAIVELLDPRLAIVLLACWAFGYMLKKTPHVPDWTIVYAVTAFSVVFSVLLLGLTADGALQGFLTGVVSVYAHQLVKQGKEGLNETK